MTSVGEKDIFFPKRNLKVEPKKKKPEKQKKIIFFFSF